MSATSATSSARQDELARIEALQARLSGERPPRTPLAALRRARRQEPTGRNRAVTELVNENEPYRRLTAQALAECEGLTVDVEHFRLGEHVMQFLMRIYGLPEIRQAGRRARGDA
jgi:hypothetical protein